MVSLSIWTLCKWILILQVLLLLRVSSGLRRSTRCQPLGSLFNQSETEESLRGKEWKCQGNADCDNPQSGDRIVYSCKKYYYSLLEYTAGTMTCGTDGKWSGYRDFSRLICDIDCGKRAESLNPLIVNGTEAEQEEHPWHGIIFREDNRKYVYICGGTLLSFRDMWFLISAAHCFSDFQTGSKYPANLFKVQLGAESSDYERNLDNPHTQTFDVHNISTPTSYHIQSAEGDIALLELNCPVKMTSMIKPICFPYSSSVGMRELVSSYSEIGNYGTVVGFGLTENGTVSKRLMKVDLPIASVRDCRARFNKPPTISQLCVGTETDSRSVCNGDSGSGFVFASSKFYLNGIVSSGSKRGVCEGVVLFTKVIEYSSWVWAVMNQDDFTVKRTFSRYYQCEAPMIEKTFRPRLPPPPTIKPTTTTTFKTAPPKIAGIIQTPPPRPITQKPSSSTRRHPTRTPTRIPTRIPTPSTTLPFSFPTNPTSITQNIPTRANLGLGIGRRCGEVKEKFEISDQTATPINTPWTISISSLTFKPGVTKCGGTLLNENWIITSANCVEWTKRRPQDLVAIIGSNHRSNPNRRSVDKIILHPEYKPPTAPDYEYSEKNLALLRMAPLQRPDDPVAWSTPACLPLQNEEYPQEKMAIVTGFDDKGNQQALGVHFFDRSKCKHFFSKGEKKRPISIQSICTGGGGVYDIGFCNGDGGSSLLVQRESGLKKFEVVGVLSVYDFCNFWQPIVFTRVGPFLKWIQDTIT